MQIVFETDSGTHVKATPFVITGDNTIVCVPTDKVLVV